MILFDWGTYNGLSKLRTAALLGTRLTEIPPRDFSRKAIDKSYFERYREAAEGVFTTITAHAPYYNVVSRDPGVMKRSQEALLKAAEMAVVAGAEIYNLHLGWRAGREEDDLKSVIDFVNQVLEINNDLVVSIEVPYTPSMLGTWEEIEMIRRATDRERVIASLQLENVWMLEKGVYSSGLFEAMDRETDKAFWMGIFERLTGLTPHYLSLRFSQIIGFAVGSKILKKRVPLGRGYPSLEPLAEALAEYMVRRMRSGEEPLRMHIIYTGPTETKYADTLRLYSEIMSRAVAHL